MKPRTRQSAPLNRVAAVARPPRQTPSQPTRQKGQSDTPSLLQATQVLSEDVVQRSVRTFDDADWLREQAVRSYALFHNSVEELLLSLCEQLKPVWRTGMQLRPEIMRAVQNELQLRQGDVIPDGVPIPDDEVGRLARQEAILDELVRDTERLRDTSVRFAAHFLTDEEKFAMGANPAYLRAEDIEHEMQVRAGLPPTGSSVLYDNGAAILASSQARPDMRPAFVAQPRRGGLPARSASDGVRQGDRGGEGSCATLSSAHTPGRINRSRRDRATFTRSTAYKQNHAHRSTSSSTSSID